MRRNKISRNKSLLSLIVLVCIALGLWITIPKEEEIEQFPYNEQIEEHSLQEAAKNDVDANTNSTSENKKPVDGSSNIHAENLENNKNQVESQTTNVDISQNSAFNISDVPKFSASAYIAVNNNIPFFTKNELSKSKSFEYYSDLDNLNRCGMCIALVGKDMMPTEERGSIGSVKPSGWHTVKYDNVDGKYLYNRCHLIGYQLTGENANEKNLITGTRYLNIQGMLPFENMVADYVKETNNHVLYRVTPMFVGNNLLADGVLMEGYSIEDSGSGIKFCAYAYNSQPGIEINYSTGESKLENESINNAINQAVTDNVKKTYMLNINSKKYHLPTCSSVSKISAKNKKEYSGNKQDLEQQGYSPCGNCNP